MYRDDLEKYAYDDVQPVTIEAKKEAIASISIDYTVLDGAGL